MTEETPTEESPRSRMSNRKRFFLRGLALLLPTVLTVLILVKSYQFIDEYVIQYVNATVHEVLETMGFYRVFQPEDYSGLVRILLISPIRWFFDEAFGFVVSILFVYMVGLLIGTLVGRRIWHAIESRLMRFPLIRFVYPFIRQVTDFVFSERKVAFRSVVAIEYPRKGVWAIGFLTGRGLTSLQKRTPKELVSIFIPSSPTPMTGYVVFVPKEDLIRLDISVDEAFRLVVSGGVITPESESRPLKPTEPPETV